VPCFNQFAMRKAVRHLRRADPLLAAVIDRIGPCRIAYREPVFDSLARSIVFQQLNGRAASSIYSRLEAACGAPLTPEKLLRLRLPRLRSLGVSPQKAAYLRDLAKRTIAGEIAFPDLASLPDQDVIERLTAVKGIGVWTAQMFLIFALRRPDVLPTGDFGVRSAMRNIYGLPDLPKPAEMERIGAIWRPWRSVASWYLWRTVDGDAEI